MSDFLDYDTIHRQHRGSVYSHNRTTGMSRTGYAFTMPKKGNRYVTLLQNLLYKPVMTPAELTWYTYYDIKVNPMPKDYKKIPGYMCAFYAAVHEEGFTEYSQSCRLWRLTRYGLKYCRNHSDIFDIPEDFVLPTDQSEKSVEFLGSTDLFYILYM